MSRRAKVGSVRQGQTWQKQSGRPEGRCSRRAVWPPPRTALSQDGRSPGRKEDAGDGGGVARCSLKSFPREEVRGQFTGAASDSRRGEEVTAAHDVHLKHITAT